MEKRFKNPRVRRILSKVFGEDSTGIDETDDETASGVKYNPRDLPKKIYHIDVDEDSFVEKNCLQISEYVPSLRDQHNACRSTSSCSLGGDSELLEILQSKLSRSPSTISNISTILNQIDFVASPSEIFKIDNHTISLSTPKNKNLIRNNEEMGYFVGIALKSPREHNFQINYNSDITSQTTSVSNSPGEQRGVTVSIEAIVLAEDTHSRFNVSSPCQGCGSAIDLKISELDTTLKPENITVSDSNQTLLRNLSRISEDNDSCSILNPVVNNISSLILSSANELQNSSINNLHDIETYNNIIIMPFADASNDPVPLVSENNMPSSLIEPSTVVEAVDDRTLDNASKYNELVLTRVSSSSVEPYIIASNIAPPILEPENNLPERPLLPVGPINDVAVDAKLTPLLAAETENKELDSETSRKRSRKRIRDEPNWKCNKNKTLKDSGLPYIGKRSKKEYPAKTIGPICSCKKKCGERITPEKRKNIFDKYYNLGSHEYQWQYIVRNVKVEKIKRTTINRKCNRAQTLKYYFQDGEDTIQVCKIFFLNTLNISDTVIFTALEKVQNDDSLIDQRGHHKNRPHKTSSSTEDSVVKHITLFPTVEAHYVRKYSQKLYLEEDLNISKMYRLYKQWFANETLDCQMASARQYRRIFNTMFNYSFFKPKKDLCAICTRYAQADEETKITMQSRYEKHVKNKDRVREIKDAEKENSSDLQTIAVFDLEKVLYVPRSEVGIFYYKRKYPVYNFTVFDAGRKLGYCYMWHLKIAKRGAIEIGSCLLKFFENEHKRAISKISLYSDGCPGQNKNRFIFALHLYAASKFGMTITHRFFETGHGQNEGDSMHACIERELKKNKFLYTPEQIYAVAMNAKVSGEKYNVIEMDQSDFVDIKMLIEGRNWTHDSEGNKILWSNIMEVIACHTHEGILKLKYNFEDDYIMELHTRDLPTKLPSRGARVRGGRTRSGRTRSGRTRGAQIIRAAATPTAEIPIASELQRAYSQPFPVPKALHTDLLSLCKNYDIPRHYHDFYEALVCESVEDGVAEHYTQEDTPFPYE